MALQRVLGQPVEDPRSASAAFLGSCSAPSDHGSACRAHAFGSVLPDEGRCQMPYYMVQAAYSTEAWSGTGEDPQNRLEAVRRWSRKLGGKIEVAGSRRGIRHLLICQMPNNVSATGVLDGRVGGWGGQAVKTTPLMTIDEGMEAMRKASGVGYRPPSD